MIWDSWNAFFEMGGYGLYVWGSVVMTFGLMFGEILLVAMRWNAGVKHLAKWLHSQQKDGHENKA